jgi:hypothetical protein
MKITKTKILELLKSFILLSEQSDNKEDKIQEVVLKALANFVSFNFKVDFALFGIKPLLKSTWGFLSSNLFDFNALPFFITSSEENLQSKREKRKKEDQANFAFENQKFEIKRNFHF